MRKNRKTIVFITLFVLIFYAFALPVYAKPPSPEIQGSSAILIDSATGKILYEKNIHEKKYPASITKIMTAIIALENGTLDDIVTAGPNAVFSIERGSSNIGILVGEQISLEELLIGLLVASANEGANVIAEHIAGSIDEFIDLMNKRAKALGANNTYFTNANGLHNDNHYTTASDMALITRHAMTIPKFRELVNIDYYEMQPTNKYKKIRYLSNTNHLINSHRASRIHNYLYGPALGIKTGYTSKANHTLVAGAAKNDMEFISVVLDAKLEGNRFYSYIDTINLFKYGFEHFSVQTVVEPEAIIEEVAVAEAKDKERVILLSDQHLQALLPNGIDIKNEIKKTPHILSPIKAPIEKGEVLGFVSYEHNGYNLGKINLVAGKNIEREPISIAKEKAVSIITSLWFKILTAALGVLLVLLLIFKIRKRRKRYGSRQMFGTKRPKIRIRRRRKW